MKHIFWLIILLSTPLYSAQETIFGNVLFEVMDVNNSVSGTPVCDPETVTKSCDEYLANLPELENKKLTNAIECYSKKDPFTCGQILAWLKRNLKENKGLNSNVMKDSVLSRIKLLEEHEEHLSKCLPGFAQLKQNMCFIKNNINEMEIKQSSTSVNRPGLLSDTSRLEDYFVLKTSDKNLELSRSMDTIKNKGIDWLMVTRVEHVDLNNYKGPGSYSGHIPGQGGSYSKSHLEKKLGYFDLNKRQVNLENPKLTSGNYEYEGREMTTFNLEYGKDIVIPISKLKPDIGSCELYANAASLFVEARNKLKAGWDPNGSEKMGQEAIQQADNEGLQVGVYNLQDAGKNFADGIVGLGKLIRNAETPDPKGENQCQEEENKKAAASFGNKCSGMFTILKRTVGEGADKIFGTCYRQHCLNDATKDHGIKLCAATNTHNPVFQSKMAGCVGFMLKQEYGEAVTDLIKKCTLQSGGDAFSKCMANISVNAYAAVATAGLAQGITVASAGSNAAIQAAVKAGQISATSAKWLTTATNISKGLSVFTVDMLLNPLPTDPADLMKVRKGLLEFRKSKAIPKDADELAVAGLDEIDKLLPAEELTEVAQSVPASVPDNSIPQSSVHAPASAATDVIKFDEGKTLIQNTRNKMNAGTKADKIEAMEKLSTVKLEDSIQHPTHRKQANALLIDTFDDLLVHSKSADIEVSTAANKAMGDLVKKYENNDEYAGLIIHAKQATLDKIDAQKAARSSTETPAIAQSKPSAAPERSLPQSNTSEIASTGINLTQKANEYAAHPEFKSLFESFKGQGLTPEQAARAIHNLENGKGVIDESGKTYILAGRTASGTHPPGTLDELYSGAYEGQHVIVLDSPGDFMKGMLDPNKSPDGVKAKYHVIDHHGPYRQPDKPFKNTASQVIDQFEEAAAKLPSNASPKEIRDRMYRDILGLKAGEAIPKDIPIITDNLGDAMVAKYLLDNPRLLKNQESRDLLRMMAIQEDFGHFGSRLHANGGKSTELQNLSKSAVEHAHATMQIYDEVIAAAKINPEMSGAFKGSDRFNGIDPNQQKKIMSVVQKRLDEVFLDENAREALAQKFRDSLENATKEVRSKAIVKANDPLFSGVRELSPSAQKLFHEQVTVINGAKTPDAGQMAKWGANAQAHGKNYQIQTIPMGNKTGYIVALPDGRPDLNLLNASLTNKLKDAGAEGFVLRDSGLLFNFSGTALPPDKVFRIIAEHIDEASPSIKPKVTNPPQIAPTAVKQVGAEVPAIKVVKQTDLVAEVKQVDAVAKVKDIKGETFSKPPIVGFEIRPGDTLSNLPAEIKDHLGKIDKTKYTDEYFKSNEGSVIALQFKNDGSPDFYMIGKETYETKYVPSTMDEFAKQNPAQHQGVLTLTSAKDSDRIRVIKKPGETVMVKMSEAGYPLDKEVKMQSPWGDTQTKPAG